MRISIPQRARLSCAAAVGFFAIACEAEFGESHDLDLGKQVDALLESYLDENGPGYAIGIIRNGELVVGTGYGSTMSAKP